VPKEYSIRRGVPK